MKYYIYLSEPKVDMLYQQIPTPLRKKLKKDFKFDLKFLSASFSEAPDLSDDNKFSKLQIVEEYIGKHEKVGTIDEPGNYFQGTIDLRWGPLFSRVSEAVFFGGETNQTILGLAGSLANVIGEIGASTAGMPSGSMSSLSSFLPLIKRELGLEPPGNESKALYASDQGQMIVDIANISAGMRGPVQHLNFLAKRLLDSKGISSEDATTDHLNKRVLLGTPLYVAMGE